MDYAEITKNINYKTGWFYSYEPGIRDKVVIHAEVEDSRDRGVRVKFMMRRIIPNAVRASQELFVDWVHDITIEAEIHEVNEFFRFNDVLLYDPHQVEQS